MSFNEYDEINYSKSKQLPLKNTKQQELEDTKTLPNNKPLTSEHINKEPFTLGLYIYLVGILFALFFSYLLYVIYSGQKKPLLIVLSFVIIVLLLNGYFSYIDPLKNFDEEIAQYVYVEENGRVLLTASLAIGVFLNYIKLRNLSVAQRKSIKFPIILGFILSCLILTLIWMPRTSGIYIRVLRDIKTIFLTMAISSVIVSMANIMSSNIH